MQRMMIESSGTPNLEDIDASRSSYDIEVDNLLDKLVYGDGSDYLSGGLK